MRGLINVVLFACIGLLSLPGCGSDCECPDFEEYDWFSEHYSECIDLCEAGNEWLRACRYTDLVRRVEDCTLELWELGAKPCACEYHAEAYRENARTEQCPGRPEQDPWLPYASPNSCDRNGY